MVETEGVAQVMELGFVNLAKKVKLGWMCESCVRWVPLTQKLKLNHELCGYGPLETWKLGSKLVCMDTAVVSYCATVTSSSATVPPGQYAKYNGNSSHAICSVDANLATQNEDGWTTIIGKQKKNGSKSLDQEKEKKNPWLKWKCSGIHRLFQESTWLKRRKT